MILTCDNCKIRLNLEGLTSTASNLLSRYGTIDKVKGTIIELECPYCNNGLKKEDEEALIIDYILEQSLKSYTPEYKD